jgi:hypothetical protein
VSDPAAVAAAVAAFVAAGVSLVNVGISARLANRSQRETWRRTEERPIVARYLTLSGDALGEWEKAGVNTPARAPDWENLGQARIADLRYQVAQLELLAGRDVARFAHSLYMAHAVEFRWLSSAEPGQRDAEARRESWALIKDLGGGGAHRPGSRPEPCLAEGEPN